MPLDAPTRTQPTTRPSSASIRLLVWGSSEADVERAISEASWGWGRKHWEFVAIERHIGVPCPIDAEDPRAIATGRHYDWAYAAYRADR